MGNWGQTLKGVFNIFLESSCPLCQRSTSKEFCLNCERQLQRCQLSHPSQLWQGQLPVFSWGVYGGSLKRSLKVLKYENQPQLARPLGHWLGEAWLKSPMSAGARKLMVIPIPLHATKQQLRGYNQAELLARSFCEVTHLSLQPLGLERVRETEAQFGLSGTGREQNLTEAFTVGKGLRQYHSAVPVLLLDDIYTTGATARSAVHTLSQHGIPVYGIVAVATPQKGQSINPS